MKPPIFIVGVPRSGTTLLAAMLSAHSEMNCGPETHFFRKLSEVDAELLCKPDTWPGAALEFLGSIDHPSFDGDSRAPLLKKYHIDPVAVSNYLAGKEASIGNILSSVTEQSMRAAGKSRWVEKTPDHIAYVHTIRKYFPDSPILRILRDPRDTALSLMTVPWGAEAFIDGLLFWKHFDDKSSSFFDHDPKSYTLRYEDLITSPELVLQAICDFIEEAYEEHMLDTSMTGRQVNSLNVPWKSMASKPVDASRVGLWRSKINKAQNQLAEALLGDRLAAYQYPREENFNQLGEIFPASSISAKYEREISDIASTGVRFWKAYNSEQSKAYLFLGDPSELKWLREGKIEKAIDIFDHSIEIIKLKMKKKNIYWIPDRNMDDAWSGYSASILKTLLSPHKVIFEN